MPRSAIIKRQILIAVGVFVIVGVVVTNPHNLKTEYGTGGGVYADQVDSFSEYIVRNTVSANLTSPGANLINPVVTKGYGEGDYFFSTLEGANPYYSNPVFQVVVISAIGRLLSVDSENELRVFFSVLRVLNALALIGLIFVSSLWLADIRSNRMHWTIPVLIAGSSGIVYFSQNLYFLSSIFFVPLIVLISRHAKPFHWTAIMIVAASLVFFLRGYEFATTYAVFNFMVASVVTPGRLRAKLLRGVAVFVMVVVGFILALLAHVALIVIGSDGQVRPSSAFNSIAGAGLRRGASLDGVPIPFSQEFFLSMGSRLLEPAFSYVIFEISQGVVLGLALVCALIFWRRLGTESRLIIIFSPGVYVSWYLFGYQHIMWHSQYDWYIFAVGITVPLCLLIALNGRRIYGNLAVDR
jgi:hypothetical protein